jgi:SAM-dependent methyltransferase
MQSKGDLIRKVIEFCHADNANLKASARSQLEQLLDAPLERAAISLLEPHPTVERVLVGHQAPVDHLSDRLLAEFNAMLPWGAMSADRNGRVVGSAWSSSKRSKQQPLIDRRLLEFSERLSLDGEHVLEVGCFEGLHTIGCLALGAKVTAVDSRMENLLKTIARLWAYGYMADVEPWDLEEPEVPSNIPESWDILHHIGVLYHQTNPAESLSLLAKRTRKAIVLDTHVASGVDGANAQYEALGRSFSYLHQGEEPISPFAGMRDHAKWLLADDLHWICENAGFRIEKSEVREERNGSRALVWAFR